MSTITFKFCDANVTVTVKEDFKKVCPNYLTTKAIDLLKEHHIMKYFHNPFGPATIDHKNNHMAYFIDGELMGIEGVDNKVVEAAEFERIKHQEHFNSKMDNLLKNEES